MADEEKTFTQDEVNRLVGEARTKARDLAKADAADQATKDKDVADQASLVANNEWKALAEKHQARVTELEPLTKQVKAYEGMVAEMLKGKLLELGEEASKAIGGLPAGMAAIEKLRWLQTNEGLFQAKGDGVGTPSRTKKKPKDKPKSETPYTMDDDPVL